MRDHPLRHHSGLVVQVVELEQLAVQVVQLEQLVVRVVELMLNSLDLEHMMMDVEGDYILVEAVV